ncbi:MAG TPA: imidazolonepropionase [Blastocatellia bacterium]|jgi:imidazolonepropionase|nr:imidazolonepropionase [Blastocatellia bacterium]
MKKSLAIIGTSQLVTLAGPRRPRVGLEMRELAMIDGGAMLIRDGRIIQTGAQNEVEPSIDADCEVVDAAGRAVTPGFVDAHTHPVFAGNRADEFEMRAGGKSYQEIAASGGGIWSTVRRTRAASAEELFEASRRYCEWFLRAGTTTVEAKSGYGLTLEDEVKMLRVIRRLNAETALRYVPTFLGAHAVPDEYKVNRSAYVDLIVNEMIPIVAREGLARFCDVFCESGAFDVDESRRILQAARVYGMGLRVHADQLSLSGGSQLAAELGAMTADHLENAARAEISALKSANVQPVLLPASVLMIGSRRYPDARAMIDAGLAVVLATDFNPGSSPTPSMPFVLTLASTQMKMSPAEAITAAAINAAYSLGLGDEIGSLEAGKRADFVIHDCEDYRELAYFAGIEHPVAVYVEGRLERSSSVGISRDG